MVVLETYLVIAEIKNLPRFLSSSSRVSIFRAARVVADFSDRATREQATKSMGSPISVARELLQELASGSNDTPF